VERTARDSPNARREAEQFAGRRAANLLCSWFSNRVQRGKNHALRQEVIHNYSQVIVT
jgi:hypothetical protein